MSIVAEPQVQRLDDDPYTDENLTDPYPLFARMRAAGPAVWLDKYQVHAFTRFELCREILADPETFVSGAGAGPRNYHVEPSWRPQGIMESDPPVHTAMRAAMGGVLSPKGVRALRERFEVFAEELVDRLVEQREFDAALDLAQVFPIRVFGDAVGIPREGRVENLLPHGAMNFSTFGPADERYAAYFAKGEPTVDWVRANCARENLTPDGLGAQIWAYADAGEISADQAAMLVRALLSAGLDTTVFSIGNTMLNLARHPQEWDQVVAKPALVKFAVDESFRLESPFQSFFRTTGVDVDFHGIHLPAETKVALFMGAANRDREHWGEDADEYRITRKASGHLAFGMGIHQCVGQPVSRLELDVVFTALAKRVRSIELAGDPVPFLHNTLRGWSSIPVRVTPL